MLFAVDVGNTSVKFGVFGPDGRPVLRGKAEAARTRSADEYAVLFGSILALHGHTASELTAGIVGSVVPPLTGTVCAAVERLCGVRPLEVGPGVRTGLNIRVDLQSQLGADIVANAVAAVSLAAPPLLVADFGTATTFTVINRQGGLEGVVICPGLRVSQEALARGGAELPDVPLTPPHRLIGKNTRESMQSGVIYGHAAMTDGLIARLREELGEPGLPVLATGGLAAAVLPCCREQLRHLPDLTLLGLYQIWRRQPAGQARFEQGDRQTPGRRAAGHSPV